ncbi:MAG: recombinase RecA, partial [Armatimonadota bacterium]
RGVAIKVGNEVVCVRTKVNVVKNKVAPPLRQSEFDLMLRGGISRSGGILDVGVEHGIITKSGAFFSYGDTRLGQGRENAKAFLDEHPEIADEIERQIRAALREGKVAAPPVAGPDEPDAE